MYIITLREEAGRLMLTSRSMNCSVHCDTSISTSWLTSSTSVTSRASSSQICPQSTPGPRTALNRLTTVLVRPSSTFSVIARAAGRLALLQHTSTQCALSIYHHGMVVSVLCFLIGVILSVPVKALSHLDDLASVCPTYENLANTLTYVA